MANHPNRSGHPRYYPNTTERGALESAARSQRDAAVAGRAVADGRYTYATAYVRMAEVGATSGLDALAAIDDLQSREGRALDAAAFLRGRRVLAESGWRLREPELAWDGRSAVTVLDRDRRIIDIDERDCREASGYGDDAGCLYFYLHRLLRPTAAMRASAGHPR